MLLCRNSEVLHFSAERKSVFQRKDLVNIELRENQNEIVHHIYLYLRRYKLILSWTGVIFFWIAVGLRRTKVERTKVHIRLNIERIKETNLLFQDIGTSFFAIGMKINSLTVRRS